MKRARSLIHLKEAYGILIELSLRSLWNSLLSTISHTLIGKRRTKCYIFAI